MDPASNLGKGTEGRAHWSLRLFGSFELSVLPGGKRVISLGKRERVLLAYLTLSPKYRQPRRKLATLLWGDATDETALDNLRSCIWNLRRALGDAEHRVVASEGEDIVLDAAAFEVDALAFRLLAGQSGRSELEGAAVQYAGEFLDGLGIDSEEFESWRRTEVSRHRNQAIDVLTRLMTQLSECGETERAIATGERILQLEPLHEAALRRLMRLYGESGRRGAAMQLYRTFADALRTDLNAQPEAETRLVFAEISRGGEKRTSGPTVADANLPLPTTSARSSDAPIGPSFRWRAPLAVVAGALIVASALASYRQFALLGTAEGVVAERAASADPASAVSIAVMPFLNLSGDANQDFFSDGMTEEITAALAMVPDLKVVARTSAFQFKGEKQDMRSVGQALNATHLIEGSVRKDGDRVRITAQLIEAAKGVHVWSESYDRRLSDIFATQEEIARTIVGSLMTPLGLAPGERLVSNRNIDPESYEQYLRAKALVRARLAGVLDAIKILEPIVARHPDYAPTWALLAQAYVLTPASHPVWESGAVEEFQPIVDASLPKADAAARRAIQLDPKNTDGYVALGMVQSLRGKLLLAEDLFKHALALDPNSPDALHWSAGLMAQVGRLKEALATRKRLQALDPLVRVFNRNTAIVLWLNGQNDPAIEIYKALPPNEFGDTYAGLAMLYAAAGRYSEAADAVLERALKTPPSAPMVQEAARLLRTAPAAAPSAQSLPRLGYLGFVYLHVGAPSRTLEFYESNVEVGYSLATQTAFFWHPSYAEVRKTERFKTFIRNAGFVDYWRARGWPEFCRPKDADDFVCA